MVKLNSNINGELLSVKTEDDKTITLKIKGGDGHIHIYKNLSHVHCSPLIKEGDLIGLINKDLYYEVATYDTIANSVIGAYDEFVKGNMN